MRVALFIPCLVDSCAADIEKILILGAHGPKRLAVIVVRDWTGA
jgi:hypothetical protein